MKTNFYKLGIYSLTFILFLAFSSLCSFNANAQLSSAFDGRNTVGSRESNIKLLTKFIEAKNYEEAEDFAWRCSYEYPEEWIYYGFRAGALRWMDPNDERGEAVPYYYKMIENLPWKYDPNKYEQTLVEKSHISWYVGANLYLGGREEAKKDLMGAKYTYINILKLAPDEPTATARLLKVNEELRITAELKARQDAELEKERVAIAARAAAAKTAKAVTQSRSYEPRWVSSSQAGLPDVVYMCQYCAITVNKAYGTGSPSNGRCSRNSTAHQWLVAGSVGTNSYSCQHCDKVISLAGGSPSNIRCPALNGSVHRWNKL